MVDENEQAIVDIIRQLCSRLSAERVTMKEAGESLGTISKQTGTELAIRPSHPSLEEARVVGESAGPGSLSHVTLKLRTPSPLSLKALEDKFGPSRPVPRTSHSPGPRAGFFVDTPGQPYTCAIIAGLSRDGKLATELIVRRDIRLKG